MDLVCVSMAVSNALIKACGNASSHAKRSGVRPYSSIGAASNAASALLKTSSASSANDSLSSMAPTAKITCASGEPWHFFITSAPAATRA